MTKYVTLIVIVALILLSVLTLQMSKDSYRILPIENSDPAKVEPNPEDFQNWKSFDSPNANFRVMLPTIPQQAKENIKDPDTGRNLNYDMYVAERLDGTLFMITLIKHEKEQNRREAERLLGAMMDDMVKSNPKNALESKSFGTYKDNPSLDFKIKGDHANIDAKTFFIGDTMYVLARVAPPAVSNPNEFDYFVDSFELLQP